MQYKSINLALALSIFSILFFGFTAANAQLSAELRPFDFTDDYYKANGIKAETLFDRKNGADGQSVFDVATDPRFNNIRILATLPAYSGDGSSIYWNHYATASKESFSADRAGATAIRIAKSYPVFVFPSTMVRGLERQAAMIPVDSLYFESNPIGVAAVVIVEFNNRISKSGLRILNMLVERNGTSIDGTPIIKTNAELGSLVKEGLVTLRTDEKAPYAIAKVLQYPERGAIAPDAFLLYVKQADGQPLVAERHFVTQFECLKNGSRTCFVGNMTER